MAKKSNNLKTVEALKHDEATCKNIPTAEYQSATDFRGLRKLKEAAGRRFKAGVVLYDGEVTAPFGEGFYAVPIRRLWEGA